MKLPSQIPGVLFCVAIAVAAKFIAETSVVKDSLHIGLLLIVILIGMLIRSLFKLPDLLMPGISYAQKPILRLAVAGLGFKLTIQELAKLGAPALLVVTISTGAALWLGYWVATRLGLSEKGAILLSVGGGICGASAIVAADSVVQSKKSDTAVALGIITFFGTVGILIYPWLGHALHMGANAYSVWNGASLHEMAQVVAAGDAFGVKGVTELSAVAKLARICLLAPTVLYLAWYMRRTGESTGKAKGLVPWFLIAFVICAAIASTGLIPKATLKAIQEVDTWLLAIGMTGVGLAAGFADLKAAGIKPILAGLIQWIFLAALSYGLVVAVVK